MSFVRRVLAEQRVLLDDVGDVNSTAEEQKRGERKRDHAGDGARPQALQHSIKNEWRDEDREAGRLRLRPDSHRHRCDEEQQRTAMRIAPPPAGEDHRRNGEKRHHQVVLVRAAVQQKDGDAGDEHHHHEQRQETPSPPSLRKRAAGDHERARKRLCWATRCTCRVLRDDEFGEQDLVVLQGCFAPALRARSDSESRAIARRERRAEGDTKVRRD